VVAERDVLQEHMEEQLLKISALQSRLDEQRRKADSQLKEANSELQTKVCDQEKELSRLHEMIENRDQEACIKESCVYNWIKIACYHSVQSLLPSHLLSRNVTVKIYRTIIVSETWSPTLREEHRLRMFENRVLSRIFGPKRNEVTGE
jgi:predicted nuclease with TOPRIM domain